MALNNEALQQQLINDLIVESGEGLDRFDAEMLLLEKGAGKKDSLNIVFRAIHTIKGTAGCIGLSKIESVAHVGENLLSLLRDGKLQMQPAMISTLLEYSDALKEMMRALEQTGTQGDADFSQLLSKLQRFAAGENSVEEKNPEPAVEIDGASVAHEKKTEETKPVESAGAWGLFADEPVAPAPTAAPVAAPAASAEGKSWGLFADEPPAPAAEAPKPAPVIETPAPAEVAAPTKAPATSVSETAIRVDVGQLDKLMNLVGELVLARNQILQFTADSHEATLLNASQRLNIITTELQESVMKTRMQPIETIWAKFPRIVRDVSRELGKKIQLVMEGSETELDRTIIEAIKDPLTHIIRNSMDHGIERPDVREQAGKSTEGLLVLRAFHEGGQVNIEIMDDGGGINVTRVKNKAVEKGLVTAEHTARMTDREVFNMIFLPGFSTAEKVTNVSGRGVGMDVVKTNIEKIGGSVDVFSEAGQGTTLKIKIPLTLAIIPALIVSGGGERFAIPQVSLLELVRLDGAQARTAIEMIYGSPVYRLRGQLLPVVSLRKLLSGNAHTDNVDWNASTHAGDTGAVFVQARNAHRAWLGRLRQVLDGHLKMTVEEAGSHHLCALGKWLYSEGLKNYGDIPELRKLEKAHETFHTLVREIVANKLAGHLAKSDEGLQELAGASEKVIDLLAIAEKRILECQAVNIVVLQADGRQFGLVVEEINDTEEIVVKPLGKQLKGISCFAGATIMGDGKVALILDVLGIAQYSKVISEVRDKAAIEKAKTFDNSGGKQTLLVFNTGKNSRLAIPLSTVARLEEFPREQVENSGGQEVVQYRGQILPLIPVARFLSQPDAVVAAADPMQVVVYSEQGRSVGLVVGKINDIVQEAITVRRESKRNGIAGSAVIQDKVTDLLDVPSIIRAADPSFYEAKQ
jgi:two-component system chemotaxis sensor kinase CheA